MVENAAMRYWRKVRTLQDGAHEDQIRRERRFAETGDASALENQEKDGSAPDNGLFLMSLEHEERCTVGGRISAVTWLNQGIGRKLADKTHRVATATEILAFKQNA